MTDLQVEQICRTCLLQCNNFVSLFCADAAGTFPQYYEMIMSCTSLKISENDGLPQILCAQCVSQICGTYTYLQQCERSDLVLREHIEYGSSIEETVSPKVLSNETLLNHEISPDIERLSDIEGLKNNKCRKKNNKRKTYGISSCKQQLFPCKKCDKHFLNWNDLNEHNFEHPKTDKTSCRFCDKEFTHIRHVSPHVIRQHADVMGFVCGYCEERCDNYDFLGLHILAHEVNIAKNDKMSIWDRVEQEPPLIKTEEMSGYVTAQILENGKQMELNKQEMPENGVSVEFMCVVCNLVFITKVELKNHQKDNHLEDNMDSICSICQKWFLNKDLLTEHEMEHDKTEFSCMKCLKTFYHKKNFEIHMKTHDALKRSSHKKVQKSLKGNYYKCETCGEKFKLHRFLQRHVKLSHSGPDSRVAHSDKDTKCARIGSNQVCDICDKSFRTTGDLRRHILTHDPDKPYHCQINRCKWSFASERDLVVHVNVNHTDGKNECHFCQKVFKHPRNLRQHMITHKQEKRFTCKFCTKGFNHLHHLTNHERTHTGDMPFLCSECGKGFGTRDRLTFHTRMHTGIRPFGCTYCTKTFTIAATLKTHLRTHTGERPFMCSKCGKTFTVKFNLNKHMRALHGVVGGTVDDGESQTHPCGVCNNVFADSAALSDHMKVHTYRYFCDICNRGFALTSALDSHLKTHAAGDRSHVCSICSSGFNRPEHLKSHIMRRHTGEKPYKCSECGRGFIQSGELNIHMRRHTGERPYVCQVCLRGFIQSNSLTSHMRTHTGERPYICAVCNRGHCTSGGLSQHMRTHNKVLPNSMPEAT